MTKLLNIIKSLWVPKHYDDLDFSTNGTIVDSLCSLDEQGKLTWIFSPTSTYSGCRQTQWKEYEIIIEGHASSFARDRGIVIKNTSNKTSYSFGCTNRRIHRLIARVNKKLQERVHAEFLATQQRQRAGRRKGSTG